MSSKLASFLAENYLAADPPRSKKPKRKPRNTSGLIFTEDDATAWRSQQSAEASDEFDPQIVAGIGQSKRTNAGWKSLRNDTIKSEGRGDPSAQAADAALASAAAETESARMAIDEEPVVEDIGSTEATAYRDATGRRIDVSLHREAARKAEHEALQKEAQASQALTGDVQAAEAKRKRENLAQAKHITFARTAGDEEMNQTLKEQQRWNDPMAGFILNTDAPPGAPRRKTARQRPVCQSSAPPNRYGIQPGYRWDGVDRGNGFEAERYRSQNRRERNKAGEYAWQID